MTKKFKRILGALLTLVMVLGMGTVAFAAGDDSASVMSGLKKVNNAGVSVNAEINENELMPALWPGDGPAPQVTQITLYDYGWLDNGNFGVIIKVYGYGRDNTTFNGRTLDWIGQKPFIISGTGADGFYYLYDCGAVTQPGDYTFSTTFTSTNFPYSERSFSTVFTFELV